MNLARFLWLIPSSLLLAALIFLCIRAGWPAATVAIVFAILPDLTLIGAFAGGGRLKPERVRAYNLAHSPGLPLGLFAISLVLLFIGDFWLLAVLASAWLLHISVDRVAGYGLREPDGTIRPVGVPRAAVR